MTTKAIDIKAQQRFAAALIVEQELYLLAQRDPRAAAAKYGVELTEEQVDLIRLFDPDAVERLRDRLFATGDEEATKTQAFLDQGGTPGW